MKLPPIKPKMAITERAPAQDKGRPTVIQSAPATAALDVETLTSLRKWARLIFPDDIPEVIGETIDFLQGAEAAEREEMLTHFTWAEILTTGIRRGLITNFNRRD